MTNKLVSADKLLKNFARVFAHEPENGTPYGWCGKDTDLGSCKQEFTEAKRHLAEAIQHIIGPDEKSKHEKRWQCPLYDDGCYEWSEYWKDSQTIYCSQDGRKMKLVEFDEQDGDDWTRNELRAEQRERLAEWLGNA